MLPIKISDLPNFKTPEDMSDQEHWKRCLNAELETYGLEYIAPVLILAARAKGMTKTAEAVGLTRQELVNALGRRDGDPGGIVVAALLKSFGVEP